MSRAIEFHPAALLHTQKENLDTRRRDSLSFRFTLEAAVHKSLAKAIIKLFNEGNIKEFCKNMQRENYKFSWDRMVDVGLEWLCMQLLKMYRLTRLTSVNCRRIRLYAMEHQMVI